MPESESNMCVDIRTNLLGTICGTQRAHIHSDCSCVGSDIDPLPKSDFMTPPDEAGRGGIGTAGATSDGIASGSMSLDVTAT